MDIKLGSKKLFVRPGVTEAQIDELIRYANTDKAVRRFTSDPKRFKNRNSFEEWRKKGKTIYTLTDGGGELLGFIWFSKQEIPQKEFTKKFDPGAYGITFAIRTYGAAQGKGLAKSFMEVSFFHYMNSEEFKRLQKGIWLETSADNIPATKLYEQFGFVQVTEPYGEKKRILMILA